MFPFFFFLTGFLFSGPPAAPSDPHVFDLAAIATRNAGAGVRLVDRGGRTGLLLEPDSAGRQVVLGGAMGAWQEARYLVLEVEHDNPFSAILYLDFYRRTTEERAIVQQGDGGGPGRPRISAKIGVLPGLPTQVVFPLSHLDGQEIFLDRFPRQLKGTVLGSRLAPADISRLALRLEPVQAPLFRPRLIVWSARLTRERPAALPPLDRPVVDALGQWAHRDWPGKIEGEAALRASLDSLAAAAAAASFPGDWSRYGGWKARQFGATGFFRTHHDGQRWWLVDPDGYAFLSVGMDCVRPNAGGVLTGQEDLFAWLPPREDSLFATCYSRRGEQELVDFYQSNLIRAFGVGWRGRWEAMTSGLLRDLRFNTVANWSDLEYARRSRLPYVLPLAGFPTTPTLLFRDFPDVFAPAYADGAARFARQLEAYRDDPCLIGYFLRNEPHWAFGAHNLAFEMLSTSQSSATRDTLIAWLRIRYQGDIARLNQAWQTQLPGFDALAAVALREPPGGSAEADLWAFSEVMVRRYVDVVCDAVKRVDPHHLNLGMRYAWISSDLLYKAGERFDVFSINGYSFPGPPASAEIARRSGKPVMIGEYHFGAVDAGLPSSGIRGVPAQTDRATAYRYYVEQGFARPEIIGLHYFQWNDQPVFGRFDGENYNIGFLDICHRPYPALAAAARASHQRIYQVATGTAAPVDSIAPVAPAIYF